MNKLAAFILVESLLAAAMLGVFYHIVSTPCPLLGCDYTADFAMALVLIIAAVGFPIWLFGVRGGSNES